MRGVGTVFLRRHDKSNSQRAQDSVCMTILGDRIAAHLTKLTYDHHVRVAVSQVSVCDATGLRVLRL
eukprot:11780372-Prorocentrum_lima.AAC.1